MSDKNTFQEAQINELKNSLIEHEQDKEIISNLKAKKENLLTVINELKIRMQKFQEETNIANEKLVAIKSVNNELQSIVKKLQKEIQEKQKSLESLTQGKENLNAILGTKIHFKKERLRFVPKSKSKTASYNKAAVRRN